MKKHLHETYPCGCWYELLTQDGEVLVLRMQTCSVCMALAWVRLDDLLTEQGAQLSLTEDLASKRERPQRDSQDDRYSSTA